MIYLRHKQARYKVLAQLPVPVAVFIESQFEFISGNRSMIRLALPRCDCSRRKAVVSISRVRRPI
jgi:hypothetical protein